MEIKKLKFDKVNEYIYYYKTSNNLEVYMYKNKKNKEVKASFVAKYGSKDNNFYSYNLKKYIEVPNGIAHFLEHKMFEYKINPFEFFSKNSADCNAYTYFDRTCYYFDCNKNFYKNLSFLINYVSNPNFTDENVEKEKGIIKQEIIMYEDYLEEVLTNTVFNNLFVNDYMKYNIAGRVEDVMKITKEDLYECYNAFYNPTNMFLVVSGNFNVAKTVDIIEKLSTKKSLELKIKDFDEPDNVLNKYEEVIKNVKVPLIGFGIKINNKNKDINSISYFEEKLYLSIIVNYLFGKTSNLVMNLKKDKLISNDLDYSIIKAKYHDVLYIETRSLNYSEVIKRIENAILNFKISKEYFNRRKKVMISNYIRVFDEIKEVDSYIIDSIINYNKVHFDKYKILKNLEYNNINFDLSNYTVTVIKN